MKWIWVIVVIVIIALVLWWLLMRRASDDPEQSGASNATDPRVVPGGPHTMGTGGGATAEPGGPGFSAATAAPESDVDFSDNEDDSSQASPPSADASADEWGDPTAPHPELRPGSHRAVPSEDETTTLRPDDTTS